MLTVEINRIGQMYAGDIKSYPSMTGGSSLKGSVYVSDAYRPNTAFAIVSADSVTNRGAP